MSSCSICSSESGVCVLDIFLKISNHLRDLVVSASLSVISAN